ncbi:hypothetical protein PFISCL1PPCAC_8508, partial [Pristionchus fissidentatus]
MRLPNLIVAALLLAVSYATSDWSDVNPELISAMPKSSIDFVDSLTDEHKGWIREWAIAYTNFGDSEEGKVLFDERTESSGLDKKIEKQRKLFDKMTDSLIEHDEAKYFVQTVSRPNLSQPDSNPPKRGQMP